MDKILIFDPSEENRETLMGAIRSRLENTGMRHSEFLFFDPEEVFTRSMPEAAQAAFFTLGNMYDAEAARQFNKLREQIPVVVVSDSEEYGIESWSLGTVYYLLRPFSGEQLGMALRRCAI